ncbi:MAG: glycosyltransferase [Candidatus Magasanikbacteria bacterium]
MTNKKILFVITQGEWGGAQRYVFDIATRLDNDFDITIAIGELRAKNDLQEKIKRLSDQVESVLDGKDQKIKIVELRHLIRAISPMHDILAIFELRRLYKILKPNIIHLNSSKAGIVGSVAKSLIFNLESSTIYTVHGWVFNEPTRKIGRLLYRFLEKITSRWKDKIIVLSDRDLRDGIKLGIDKSKFVKIPLGIKIPHFLHKEEARGILSKISNIQYPISNILVGTIANLYPSKGIDVLIEAAKIINIQYPISNIQFVVIGEGSERKKLESLIANYKLQNIHLIGSVENAAQYLKAFDIFVLPSRKEGLPYTLLEAMSAGLPIIASDVGGISSLIDNKINGLIIPHGQPEKLTKMIVSLSCNTKLREEIKKHVVSNSRAFDIKDMITQLQALFLSLSREDSK